jgi:hypothetical protein
MAYSMKIVTTYSHKDGLATVQQRFGKELAEIREIISKVDASKTVTKVSEEKTMPGAILYSPDALNDLFKAEFRARGWSKKRLNVSTTVKLTGQPTITHNGYREMDFLKNKLGVEVQFGKYAFMVYNVSAKMTIFHNKGIIDAGVEIVPMKKMADRMSSGVSFLEQFKTDLEMRGVADIDIPVLIIGIEE